MDREILLEKVNKAKLISFDLFDTLLFRKTSEPETVFDIVGKHYGIEGFRRLRVNKQNEASQRVYKEFKYPHADMNEIYEEFSVEDLCGNDPNKVKEYEIYVESEALVANTEMLEIFNEIKARGKRIVITTDMYLLASTLDEFLRKNGFEGYSKIYCSADERKAKFNRELFEEVAKNEGLEYSEILHIGDNASADVDIPSSFGIDTFLYKSDADFKKDAGNADNGVEKGIYKICYDETKGFWFNFGVEAAGPVYIGLYKWLEEEVKKSESFYFIARDGYYLYRLFKENGYKNVKYLYASRRSLIMAGITELDEEALKVLPPYTFGQTVGELIDYLGIDRKDIELEGSEIESFDYVIKDEDDFKRFRDLLCLNPKPVLERCSFERKNAISYFESVGFFDSESKVFDCGWNGSSQYLIERLKKAAECDKETTFYYFGILNTPKSRKQLHGYSYKTYLFDFYRNYNIQSDVKNNAVMYELLFSAPHPSVYIYGEDGVVFEDGGDDEYKNSIFEGILRFYNESISFIDRFEIEIFPVFTVSNLKRLIANPTDEEATVIGNVDNVDGFARKDGEIKKIAYVTKEMLEKNPKTEVYWIQGLLKRNDVTEEVKEAIKKREGFYPEIVSEYNLEPNRDLLTYKNFMDADTTPKKKAELDNKPLFSIVMPVYNVVSEQLKEAIDSVLTQSYDNFELILIDDCSTWENVRPILNEYEKNDHVKVIYRSVNGHISKATNDGIEVAEGEYLFFMDCDDTIDPDAFYEFARVINENRELDFIYSDEDKLTEDGKIRHLPFFKPDWSPDFFWCENYTNHLSAYRTSIAKKIGGLRSKYDGAQDYDFVLRFMEESEDSRVGHISKILYHWRERKESVAFNLNSKNYATEATGALKTEALKRRNIAGHMEYVSDMSQYRPVYDTVGNPLVSIIIPSKDNPKLLKQCIGSLQKFNDYKNIEIIVVDNGSNPQNKEIIQNYLKENHSKYIYGEYSFNFSYMCNLGVDNSNGEYLLFLNDDVEAIDSKWLDRMLGHAMQKNVGAVGAKLLYPETTRIQHAGVINLREGPGHAFIRQEDWKSYYFGLNRLESNFIAVTAACLLVSKEKFIKAGKFDEEFKVAYNDIDLCFNLYEGGYFNVMRQDAILYHHESYSRGDDIESPEKTLRLSKEKIKLYLKHPRMRKKDPFLNTNIHNYAGDVLDLYSGYGKLENFVEPESVPFSNAAIDSIVIGDTVTILGWSFLPEEDNTDIAGRYLILKDGYGDCFKTKLFSCEREDVINTFDKRKDIYDCGFKCCIDPKTIRIDEVPYKLGVQTIGKDGISHIYWDENRGYITSERIGKKIFCEYRDIKDFKENSGDNSNSRSNIDSAVLSEDSLEIRGWAFAYNEKISRYRISIVFTSDSKDAREFEVIPDYRPDIAAIFCNDSFITHTGFRSIIFKDALKGYNMDRATLRLTDVCDPANTMDMPYKLDIIKGV